MKKALITGITGQDGSYLAELLLSKGYEVHGIIRRASSATHERISHIEDRLNLHTGDLLDSARIRALIQQIEVDEVYNLAAQSHVGDSFVEPVYTMNVTGLGALRLLEAVRQVNPKIRYYQASSSEMFGNSPGPQSEQTPFRPRSPYACAKVCAHFQTVNYREAYGIHASSGILFNHESPRRGEFFVTRKITLGLAAIAKGKASELRLGNLDAVRDWGFAGDYVEAMWRMVQAPAPGDYVVATGEGYTVRDFLDAASAVAGVDWHSVVKIDPAYMRPSEVPFLRGDARKAKTLLGWTPKTAFGQLAEMMMKSDLEKA